MQAVLIFAMLGASLANHFDLVVYSADQYASEYPVKVGSSDGLLQCWELGECTSGYAPWPQFQHDCGRSGVLE